MDGKNFDDLTRKLATGTSRRNVLRGLIGGGAALVGMKAADISAAPRTKVTLCHATASDSNPWVMITVDPNSYDFQGHLNHGDFPAGTGTAFQCCRAQDCAASTNPCEVRVCNQTFDDNGIPLSGTCGFEVAGTDVLCRAAAGVCDLPEYCDGVSVSCPDDLKSTDLCRAAVGDCDVEEYCDGVSNDCPTDDVAGTDVLCRAATGACDVAEYCDGSSKDCPIDAVAGTDVLCRAAAGECDVAEYCDGVTKDCPADGVAAASVECRAAANECDLPEYCDGSSKDCPADVFKSDGTACTDDGDDCTDDVCVGGACTHPDNGTCGQCDGTCPWDDDEIGDGSNGSKCCVDDDCDAGCCNVSAGNGCPYVCAPANSQVCQGS